MLLRYEGSVEHPTPPDARGMSVQQTAQTTTEHESTNKAVTARKVTPLIGGPTTAPKKNKQSFDYILKTGIAGGLAGCAVSSPSFLSPQPSMKNDSDPPNRSYANPKLAIPRPKQLWAPSIALKSSSKPLPPNLPNTPALGSVS